MFEDLSEIKKIRKSLGLSQVDLAKQSGVSQSLIAKVESGNLDPSYSKTMMLFDTLKRLQEGHALTAETIMQKKVISVTPKESLKKTFQKMKKYGFSQLPVIDKAPVGFISETMLLDGLLEHKTLVKEAMGALPPIVAMHTSSQVLSSLLHQFPMVLVAEQDRIKGVVTKFDLLEALAKRTV